jgi:hypothetical protein
MLLGSETLAASLQHQLLRVRKPKVDGETQQGFYKQLGQNPKLCVNIQHIVKTI